jgi:nucleotide-binding universal stress UspA family protein
LNHKHDNSLLVLIRRERGLLDKLFRKNHSEEFAQSPTLPVMIIHE